MTKEVYRELLKKNLLPFWKRNRAVRRISAGQRPQTRIEAHEALVPTPKSQHPGDEMAKSEPRPQPDRAFVGSSEAQSRWKKV